MPGGGIESDITVIPRRTALVVHDNAFHFPDYEEVGVSATQIETHRTGATHVADQPPADHGNAKHTPDFLPDNARIPLSCTPDGAAGLVLTGNGAGNDPSYQAAPGGVMPSGLIVMWHGTIGNIPAGYVICDGNNSTPNLLGRFVRQVATAATNPGGTGGSNTHTHATHTTDGLHDHDYHSPGGALCGEFGEYSPFIAPNQHSDQGGHTHNAHQTVDNIPLRYDLAFIMKT